MKTPPPDPRIERARYSLILDAPFWGALMVRLPVFPGYERPTFCTDGKRIRYNQAYADTLTDGEIRYALCHEIAHCAMGHLWRPDTLSNFSWDNLELWNRACDYVVNQMLDDYAADCVKQGRDVPWTRPKEWLVPQPQFRGLSAEEIYREMVGNPPPPQQSQDGSGGGQGQPGQSQPQARATGDGQPDPNGQPQPRGKPGTTRPRRL